MIKVKKLVSVWRKKRKNNKVSLLRKGREMREMKEMKVRVISLKRMSLVQMKNTMKKNQNLIKIMNKMKNLIQEWSTTVKKMKMSRKSTTKRSLKKCLIKLVTMMTTLVEIRRLEEVRGGI